MKNNENGLLLLELIVYVSIMAIVYTVAMPRVTKLMEQMNGVATTMELRNIQAALYMYELENGGLPPKLKALHPNYISKDVSLGGYTYDTVLRKICLGGQCVEF